MITGRYQNNINWVGLTQTACILELELKVNSRKNIYTNFSENFGFVEFYCFIVSP